MNNLLVVAQDAPHYAQLLAAANLADLRVTLDTASLSRCNLLLGEPRRLAPLLDRVERAPHVAWVQSTFAGVDALCRPGLRRDYHLTGVKGIFGPLMSEYVFAYLLALERRLFEARENQRAARWQPLAYRPLAGKTMGVAGLGDIGRHIAATGRHFGLAVRGYRRSGGPLAEMPEVAVYGQGAFDAFLQGLDYLVLVLPDTPATQGLVDSDALSRLPSHAVVVNVGRGAAVDQDALAAALAQGGLRAAVLDVFQSEPLPADHPLWHQPNAYLTPHHAAVSFPADIVALFAANYRRFCRGLPLDFEVDFTRGY